MHKVCKQMHFILVAHKQRTALYILFLTHACSHAHALQLWETSSTIFLKHCISLSLCHPTVNMIAPFYRFSCHFSFAPGFCLWTLVLHVTTIACKCVGACVCVSASFLRRCLFVISFFYFFKSTLSKCKLCQAKDQSRADAHTCDVSADPSLRVRWQLSISVTCWFILLSSLPIPPAPHTPFLPWP